MSCKVVFLEDDEDLRYIMRAHVKSILGLEALCYANVNEFIADPSVILKAHVIFLDVNLGKDGPSGIDACQWLRENAFSGKIFFLTGHAKHHPLVQEASALGIEVLEKPIRAALLGEIITTNLRKGSQ